MCCIRLALYYYIRQIFTACHEACGFLVKNPAGAINLASSDLTPFNPDNLGVCMKLSIFIASLLLGISQLALADDNRGTIRVSNMNPCQKLPSTIRVVASARQCGNMPAVILRGNWKRSFSAAFRWDDGSADGQDRDPNKLWDSSAASSPYKTQRRIRRSREDILCYGNFLKANIPVPEQLTIKRSVAPRLDRFCVDF
jgi:hypothetical protein